MTIEFNIPKTDLNTMCEVSDLELINNFQTKTDAYLKLPYVKRIANDAFDMNDSTANLNYQVLPAQTCCYNPFLKTNFFFSQSNTCANSTSLTTAPLEIAFDTVPYFNGNFPTPSEDVDDAAKAAVGNFNTVTGGNCTSSVRHNYSSNIKDKTPNFESRGTHKLNFNLYVTNWDSVYYSASYASASILSGDSAVYGDIHNQNGGLLFVGPNYYPTQVYTQTIGYHSTRYGMVRPSAKLAVSGAGVQTHSATIYWSCYVRTGQPTPGGYPGKVRSLTTGNMVFQINGTDMKYVNAYINADTTGGLYMIEYSTDNITYYTMSSLYSVGNETYFSESIAGLTNTFYIKLTLLGTAGTSCSISRFAGEGL